MLKYDTFNIYYGYAFFYKLIYMFILTWSIVKSQVKVANFMLHIFLLSQKIFVS